MHIKKTKYAPIALIVHCQNPRVHKNSHPIKPVISPQVVHQFWNVDKVVVPVHGVPWSGKVLDSLPRLLLKGALDGTYRHILGLLIDSAWHRPYADKISGNTADPTEVRSIFYDSVDTIVKPVYCRV